jgi:hypothetical protein
MVFFLLLLPRNAQKRTKKKGTKKQSAGGWVGQDLANARGGSVDFFAGSLFEVRFEV